MQSKREIKKRKRKGKDRGGYLDNSAREVATSHRNSKRFYRDESEIDRLFFPLPLLLFLFLVTCEWGDFKLTSIKGMFRVPHSAFASLNWQKRFASLEGYLIFSNDQWNYSQTVPQRPNLISSFPLVNSRCRIALLLKLN